MLQTLKFNQLKAVLKDCEEVPSCFNTYGCHTTEKDFFFLRSDTNIKQGNKCHFCITLLWWTR